MAQAQATCSHRAADVYSYGAHDLVHYVTKLCYYHCYHYWYEGTGVGWEMEISVISNCFSGLYPPQERVTRNPWCSLRRGDVPSFQRPQHFLGRVRSTHTLWGAEAAAAGPGVILIRRYTATRLGRGQPGAAACWPWLVSGCTTYNREIRNLRRPEPS